MSTEGTPDPASQPSDPVGGGATPSAEPPEAPEPEAAASYSPAEPEAAASYSPAEPAAASSYPPAEPEAAPSYPPAEPEAASSYPTAGPEAASSYPPAGPEAASSYPPARPAPSSYPPPEYGQPPSAPPYGPGGPAGPGYQEPGYQQPGYQQPGYQQPPPGYGYQQPAYPPAYGPAPLSPSDERLWATLAHVGPILTSFLAPLLIWLILRERSRFVDDQGKEALNFQIFLAIVYVVGFLTTFILVGFLILPVAWIVSIVFGIQGAIVAGRGELYRYPLTWRVIK